ncbi:MAG TPA: amidohydrolase family protein [Acidimicrobiia bacterium]|nr:amidohydrolase family protein [Acidimicrobiia bacterium]
MSLRDHVICDSDLHVMEPPDLWERYIEPEYAHAAPRGLSEIQRDMRVKVKNHVMLRLGGVRPQRVEGRKTGWREEHDNVYAASEAAGWDAASQVAAMDAEGLDMAVLYPSRGLFVLGLDSVEQVGPDGLEPEYATAIARAYNNWMKDFCDVAPTRMFGAGMVAPHDVDGAVVEARRCVEELGFKAIFLAPATVNRRPWHHPAYDPLWAEVERLDVPIAFHGGGQTYLTPDFSLEVLPEMMLWHSFSQPLGIQFVTACFTGGGILQRFPDLRVALLEGNCSWAPWFMYRLDEHYEWTGWYEAPSLTMKPSDYFRRNCWISVESDEDTVTHFIDTFGYDKLVTSTDYPHGDSKFPHAVDAFDKLPMSDEARIATVGNNWSELYKIPLVKQV